MATIKPFRGIRPPQELVEEIECRPYDVLDSEEARAEAGDNCKAIEQIPAEPVFKVKFSYGKAV